MSIPGGPRQINPESAVLVSRTSRNALFGSVVVDLGLDFLRGHCRQRRMSKTVARLIESRELECAQTLAQHLLQRVGGEQSSLLRRSSDVIG
jgi:hypothetical protein